MHVIFILESFFSKDFFFLNILIYISESLLRREKNTVTSSNRFRASISMEYKRAEARKK